MQQMIIRNLSQPLSRPLTARYCVSFPCRLRGLTFRRAMSEDLGLLLVQERDSRMDAAIHMLFVWMDLAVVWINSAGKVVDLCLARRWRPAYIPKKPARYVLEMTPARLQDFKIGDDIRFEENVTAG